MKKTRKTIPLTQREMEKLLRRPQTQMGFEIAVTSDDDATAAGLTNTQSTDSEEGKRPSVPDAQVRWTPKGE